MNDAVARPGETFVADPARSDFWSDRQRSAWWYVNRPDGRGVCATRGRTFLRTLKRALRPWPFDTAQGDDGRWGWPQSQLLHYQLTGLPLVTRGEGWPASQVPFDRNGRAWTRDMLRLGIWFAYHREQGPWTMIELPADTRLPVFEAVPPGDDVSSFVRAPQCVPAGDAFTRAPARSASGGKRWGVVGTIVALGVGAYLYGSE